MNYKITGGQLVIKKRLFSEMLLTPNHPLIVIMRHMAVIPDQVSTDTVKLDFNFKKAYEFNETLYERLKSLLNKDSHEVKGNMVITCLTTHASLYTTIEF